jgi:F-type H+-transporting ATPase subunit delta
MSSLASLARPYAKAAFELAQGEQASTRWDEMLELASALATDELMANLLDNPQVGSGRVAGIISEAAGDRFDKRFNDFLSILASNGRLSLLPQVLELFREFRKAVEKRLSVRVISAVPLDEDQAGRLRAVLAKRFECDIELDNEIDPDVIGGAVVYAGDQVIDGSIKGKLQKLSGSLNY